MCNKTDVVVVGGGGAGLCAAVEAASLGRKVIVIEKTGVLGGSTLWAIGSLSSSATPHQIKAHIKDSPRLHWEDIPKFDHSRGRHAGGGAHDANRTDNEALRRLLTDSMPDTIRWLISLGIDFVGPMPEPPHRLPRMLNVVPNARAYVHRLSKAARRLGVDLRLNTRAVELLLENGRVTGVKVVSPDGKESCLTAAGGVILASGDYSASADLKSRFMGSAIASVKPINSANTGDGHLMAEALNASIVNAHLANTSVRFVPPSKPALIQRLPPSRLIARLFQFGFKWLPPSLIRPFIMNFVVTAMSPSPAFWKGGAMPVNCSGALIDVTSGDRVAALLQELEHQAFFLFDQAVAERFAAWPNFISTAPGIAYAYLSDYERGRKDLFWKNQTIAGLAAAAGMNAALLSQSVQKLDRCRPEGLGAVRPPYFLIGPATVYVTTTDGGLAVDHELRVLGPDGQAIAGLYAAGGAGQGGTLLPGHGHHLGWAFSSGRRAGRNAAFETADT